MNFFAAVFGLSCLFIALIMVCAWLDAKNIAPLRQANKPPEPAPQQTLANLRNLYDCYSLHYENFAEGVFDCLTAVARQYRLVQVNNPRGVHSARAAN